MASVELSDPDWQRVINLIATKNLYVDCVDVLMKIGTQLNAQARPSPELKAVLDGNGKEVRHE